MIVFLSLFSLKIALKKNKMIKTNFIKKLTNIDLEFRVKKWNFDDKISNLKKNKRFFF